MTLADALSNPWGNNFLAGLAKSMESRGGYLTPREREAALRVAASLELAQALAERREERGITPRRPGAELRYFQACEEAIAESRDYSIKLALEADDETGLVCWAGMPRKVAPGDLPRAWKNLDPQDNGVALELYVQRIPIRLVREVVEELGRQVIESEGPGGVINSLRFCRRAIEAKWRKEKQWRCGGRWSEETFDWE